MLRFAFGSLFALAVAVAPIQAGGGVSNSEQNADNTHLGVAFLNFNFWWNTQRWAPDEAAGTLEIEVYNNGVWVAHHCDGFVSQELSGNRTFYATVLHDGGPGDMLCRIKQRLDLKIPGGINETYSITSYFVVQKVN